MSLKPLLSEADYEEYRDHLLSKRQMRLLAAAFANDGVDIEVATHVAVVGLDRFGDETLTAMFLHQLFEYVGPGDRPVRARCNEDGRTLSEWLVKHCQRFRNAVARTRATPPTTEPESQRCCVPGCRMLADGDDAMCRGCHNAFVD